MKTVINRFGEKQTNWTSHKHPDNPNFMQLVKYMHIQHPDGRNNLHWKLENSAANDNHLISNITLSEAQLLYSDVEELTDDDFEKWLIQTK